MNCVLVLDPEQRAALATVRSIGRRGIEVMTAGYTAKPIAAVSRYCSAHHLLPDPASDSEVFLDALGDTLKQVNADVLLPVTDLSTSLVLGRADLLSKVATALPNPDAYHRVSNKYALFELARAMGLPMPKTVFLNRLGQLANLALPFPYPVVVKPARSRIQHGEHWVSTSVAYASCEDDLLRRIRSYAWFPHTPILLQEYVEGEGQGVFCFFDHGKPAVYFAHRRLREKPPSGGVSVLCESAPVPARMRDMAEALLRPLDWHGLAMVELKVAPDGTPYLMEVNARPWGSMQLAIDAGVDFPYLQYCVARGLELPSNLSYRCGIRSRWLLGDLDRLYLVLKDGSGRYPTLQKGREVLEFLRFWDRSGYDTFQLRDFGPFRAELTSYLRQLRG